MSRETILISVSMVHTIRMLSQRQVIFWLIKYQTLEPSHLVQAAGSLLFCKQCSSKLHPNKYQSSANKMNKIQLFTIILWPAEIGIYSNKTILIVSNCHSDKIFYSYLNYWSLLVLWNGSLWFINLRSSK